MKTFLDKAIICCLLLLCEPANVQGAVEVVTPLEPVETVAAPTPTLAPTLTPAPTIPPTCTPMPWPTDTPAPTPEVVVIGKASQYAPGVMERVVRTRQKWGQIPQDVSGYAGYVAARDCADIGRVVWLRPCGHGQWQAFLVVDCASKSDRQSDTDLRSGYEWMLSEGVLFELDGETARDWNTVGRMICIEMLGD